MSEMTKDKIKFLGMEGVEALLEGIKNEYAPLEHEHDVVVKAESAETAEHSSTSDHATSADEATHATNADNATNAEHANVADTATKAEQDGNGNVIADTYALVDHTHSWNDLKDKPFYEIESEGGFGVLLEETDVEIGEDLYTSIPIPVELEVDKEYVVVFNGTTYNCVSWYSDDNSAVMLGNGSIYGGEGQGEDVPFSIDFYGAYDSYLNTVNEGVYTISISGELPSLQIVTIDEKFIPSDIARFYDVETYVDERMNDYDRRLNEHMEERLDTKADSYHEHNWRDISNKPFGYEISSQENIVPYQSITISDYTATIEGFTVLPDCPYTIIYNGTEYKVRSVPHDSMNTYGKTYSRINILDYTLGYDNETSSLPFCIEGYDNENNATLYTNDIENGEITIEITRGYVIGRYETIDEKFLPDSVVRVTDMPEQVTKTSQLINDSGFVINNDLTGLETKEDAQAKLDEAKGYTDTAVANLVNSAPETLDTLGELAEAFNENKEVVDALNEAIVNKADAEHSHSYNDLTDRTHYITEKYEEILRGSIYSSTYSDSPVPYYQWLNKPEDILIVGDKYRVTYKGEEYVVTCKGDWGDGVPYLGNPSFYSSENIDTGESFLIVYLGDGFEHGYVAGNHQIVYGRLRWYTSKGGYEGVVEHIIEEVVQLDEKYIPDTIARVSDLNNIDLTGLETKEDASAKLDEAKEYAMSKVNPEGTGSLSLNRKADTVVGDSSVAAGVQATASAQAAISLGLLTTASATGSMAEGYSTTAAAVGAHAEGVSTTAAGSPSHAEGSGTQAIGNMSHTEGSGTIALTRSQHVQGEYNIIDSGGQTSRGTYAHIVGNGTSDSARSNAHTVDWDGNAWFAGTVTVGASKIPLATAADVSSKVPYADFNSAMNNKADKTHKHDDLYDVKGASDEALISAKAYADTAATTVKNDLLNGAGEAYDTLKELGELIDENTTALDALEEIATSKADVDHTHSWNDLEDKPFGEKIVEGIHYTYDENPENIQTYEVQYNDRGYDTQTCIKISDSIPDIDVQSISGIKALGTMTEYDGEFEYKLSDCSVTDGYVVVNTGNFPSAGEIVAAYIFIVLTDEAANNLGVPTTGVYASYAGEMYFSELHISEVKELVQLDPKYIKDMYYEELNEVILVDNLTSEEFSNGEYPKCNFILGNTYRVIVNGDVYDNLVCHLYEDEWRAIASSQNGCPFYIDDDGGDDLYVERIEGDFVLSIIDITNNKIHHLDQKYLPDHKHEWNDIADIPFYDTREGKTPEITTDVQHVKFGLVKIADSINFDFTKISKINIKSDYNDFEITNLPVEIVGQDGYYEAFSYIAQWYDYRWFIYIETQENADDFWGSSEDNPFTTGLYVWIPDLGNEESGYITNVTYSFEFGELKQLDTKYLPIMDEVCETVFEIDEIVYDTLIENTSFGKLVGKHKVTVDGESEIVEFIDGGDWSYGTGSFWDVETSDYQLWFGCDDEEAHSVKIESVEYVVKKEHLPDSSGVFIAEQYVTPFEEIYEAYNAGRQVVCQVNIADNTRHIIALIPLTMCGDIFIRFNGIDGLVNLSCTVDNENNWNYDICHPITREYGGFLNESLYLDYEPEDDFEAINKKYVDNYFSKVEHSHSWDDLEDKPFYDNTTLNELISETTLEFESADFNGMQYLDEINLVEGDTYRVIWDGNEYDCVCHTSIAGLTIGNDVVAGAGSINNGEPFFIALWEGSTVIISSEAGSHTFTVSEIEFDIHPIDEKYLPNTTKYRADWNENDSLSNKYVENRTHYTVFEGNNLVPYTEYESYTWSGVDYSVISLSFLLDTIVPNSEDGYFHFVAGSTYTILLNEKIYTCVAVEFGNEPENTHVYIGDPDLINYPFCLWDFNNHTSTGGLNKEFRIKSTKSNHFLGIYEGAATVRTLPEMYLPETTKYQSDWNESDPSSAAHIKNKPFYLEKDGTLLSETTLSREPLVDGWDLFMIKPGKTYHVTFDGVRYECECKAFNDDWPYYIGNGSLYYDGYEDTGEPFCITLECYYSAVYYSMIYMKESGQHTLGIDEFFIGEITVNSSDNNMELPIIAGETYEVIWDGVTYTLTAQEVDGYYPLIGNARLSDETLPDTGEPFVIFSTGLMTTEGEHTFSVTGLIPERTHNFKIIGSTRYDMAIELNTGFDFVDGETYKIIFDGIEYEFVWTDDNIPYIGNASIGGLHVEDTGEPFYIQYSNKHLYDVYMYYGSHTLEIKGDKYHTIDEVYLPTLVGKLGQDGSSEIFNDYENNVASGGYSHSEGWDTTATGYGSHAEGGCTEATGNYSHAEGGSTIASGSDAHAEGSGTESSGWGSHTEGCYTEASNTASHAEGYTTIASGKYSHSEGLYTKALSDCQHVQGRYSIEDTENKYAHIVGNGDYSKNTGWKTVCSNAHTLDWNGNSWYKGDVYVGGTSQDEGSKKLATEEYVASNTIAPLTEEEVIELLTETGFMNSVTETN